MVYEIIKYACCECNREYKRYSLALKCEKICREARLMNELKNKCKS